MNQILATEIMVDRNLIIAKIDLKRVFKVIHEDIGDLNSFLKEIFKKIEIS